MASNVSNNVNRSNPAHSQAMSAINQQEQHRLQRFISSTLARYRSSEDIPWGSGRWERIGVDNAAAIETWSSRDHSRYVIKVNLKHPRPPRIYKKAEYEYRPTLSELREDLGVITDVPDQTSTTPNPPTSVNEANTPVPVPAQNLFTTSFPNNSYTLLPATTGFNAIIQSIDASALSHRHPPLTTTNLTDQASHLNLTLPSSPTSSTTQDYTPSQLSRIFRAASTENGHADLRLGVLNHNHEAFIYPLPSEDGREHRVGAICWVFEHVVSTSATTDEGAAGNAGRYSAIVHSEEGISSTAPDQQPLRKADGEDDDGSDDGHGTDGGRGGRGRGGKADKAKATSKNNNNNTKMQAKSKSKPKTKGKAKQQPKRTAINALLNRRSRATAVSSSFPALKSRITKSSSSSPSERKFLRKLSTVVEEWLLRNCGEVKMRGDPALTEVEAEA